VSDQLFFINSLSDYTSFGPGQVPLSRKPSKVLAVVNANSSKGYRFFGSGGVSRGQNLQQVRFIEHVVDAAIAEGFRRLLMDCHCCGSMFSFPEELAGLA
jgi:hypothetical protein